VLPVEGGQANPTVVVGFQGDLGNLLFVVWRWMHRNCDSHNVFRDDPRELESSIALQRSDDINLSTTRGTSVDEEIHQGGKVFFAGGGGGRKL
jgi:hypothetical protein